jgi:cysteinyl-tRNA synthetase
LNIQPATHYPKATEYINHMITMIQSLLHTKHAYEANGSIYYRVKAFEPRYGIFVDPTIPINDESQPIQSDITSTDGSAAVNSTTTTTTTAKKATPTIEMIPGAGGSGPNDRKGEDDKEDPRDFALWKAYNVQDLDVYWEGGKKLGKGRPGTNLLLLLLYLTFT